MNSLVLPLKKRCRSRLIPLLTSFSRDSEFRARLSEAEKAEAEESREVYCKPIEFYTILQRRAEKNPSFLQRSLHYKLQVKNKKRILISIFIRGAISDGLQTPNLFPFYIVLARPVSTPDGETLHSSSYRFKRACKLTTFIEGQTASSAQAKFILPEINKLSAEVESGSVAMLLVSCTDITNPTEIDLTKDHTFSPSYEGYCLFGKIPIDFLRLSWEKSPTLSLGERVEVLLTVTMQSCYMKSSCSGEDKCLSFQFPNNSEAVSILQQVPITITAEELGSKDKSAYDLYSYNNVPTNSLPRAMRLRAGSVVFYYKYYNNMLQMNEVTEDNSCPFCLVKCASYKGLKCHLLASHDLFRYEFWVDEDYQIVFIYARTDSNSSEIFGSLVDPKEHKANFCHKPLRRRTPEIQNQDVNHVDPLVLHSDMPAIPVEIRGDSERIEGDVATPNAIHVSYDAAITFVEPESTNLSVPESNITSLMMLQFAKTRKLSVEHSATRKQMLLQKRQFFHSHGAQPMTWEQVIAEEDSEDEVDDDVADLEDRRMLEDFVDVNQHEKRIMHLWNSLIRKQRVLADGHIPWACEVFSDLHGEELVQTPQLLWCWHFFIVKLWNHGLIDQKTISYCHKIVEKYRHQIQNQDI